MINQELRTLVKKVRKRNGEIVDFDLERIKKAVLGPFSEVFNEKIDLQKVSLTVEIVKNKISAKFHTNSIPAVEEIQDIIEESLMEISEPKVARAFIIYREERKKLRSEREDALGGQQTELKLSPESARVIASRYLTIDKNGKVVEIPEEMFARVSRALAEVEYDYLKPSSEVLKLEKDFYEIMTTFKFLPAGRTLRNAGGPTALVANCIVLDFEDDMRSIFSTLTEAAVLQQAGSGLGFPFHLLRPAGMMTIRTRGVSSGPVSFLQIYNRAFGIIKQQGRHGANMAIMSIDHPDILEFINCKKDEGSIENFNISVGLTDKFMKEVESNSQTPWMCEWKGVKMKPRRIFRDNKGRITKIEEVTMTAKDIFDEIIDAAWGNGEPGVVFLDEVNKTNPLPELGRIEACNPCGEQFLHAGDVCNLGSINLEKFVKNKKIDWDDLERTTRIAIRMLDNVIDRTDFPSERVNTMFRSNRRIGLGIMGFGNALFRLRVAYNSDEGRGLGEKFMKFINDVSHDESSKIAEEKGVFGNWDKSVYFKKGIKMRNAALTTCAPTGSISMAADTSSGIEPNFALAFKKIVQSGVYNYFNQPFKEALEEYGIRDEKILEEIVQKGSLKNIKGIPEEMKRIFVTAMDISAEDHILMQVAFQKHVDNSISKTINFPNSATKEDVKNGYFLGWKNRLKGLTVYRDGSREVQVLELNSKTSEKKKVQEIDNEESENIPLSADSSKLCPDCGDMLHIEEGCNKCYSCGFSYCEK
ncbi:MAG: vitamin B12-dependent ribonucleotide reductase [Patescibacteria group bacterium]